ncbi:ABC transporter permease [Cetobacterium sp. 8H]|uniref:nickel transporter permease n=1 Tax=Cetobacterium sp. 8H TaxID=2759681 RepID=UPI00163C9250|nr:nickel transporter permease [Cetobacterium sp. 8H]MBC2852152.1 ABC transporter permease [Cetobacterium sp. 8H]
MNILKNKQLMIFSILGLSVILVAIFAPWIATKDPYSAVMSHSLIPPGKEYILGTDRLGRDVFSRIIYGIRPSIIMTFSLITVVFIIGTTLGIVAGYFGGVVDDIIMRLADMMISFPGLVLAIAIAGILGPNMVNSVLAVSLVSWPKYTRLSRSLILKIKKSMYIEAAIISGGTPRIILQKHLIPNMIPTVIVTATTDIGTMMLKLASLSFLGFGAQAPTPEWGLMLNEGRKYMTKAPWLIIYPGISIIIVIVIFNMLGDSVRDLLNPKKK